MATNSPSSDKEVTRSRLPSVHEINQTICDAALGAYQALPERDWRGSAPLPGGEILFPNPVLAREYLAAGEHAFRVHGDCYRAIELLNTSIRLDYAGSLEDADNLVLRVEAYHELGEERPARSILLYNLAVSISRQRRWREAAIAYRAAGDLDPLFSWHLNNLAWQAATSTIPEALNGELALAFAANNCVRSGFGCWAFLGTLAASYARAGDYARAVAWQRIATKLTPEAERQYSEARIVIYEAGQPFVDLAPRPIGGVDAGVADEATFQDQWKEALALMGAPPPVLH